MGRYVTAFGSNNSVSGVAAPLVTLLIISPFLWALALRKVSAEATARLKENTRYRGPLIMVRSMRIALALFFIGFLINNMLSLQSALIALAAFVVLMLLTYRKLQVIYDRIERRFMRNLNDKEKREQKESGVHLVPWDAHISSFTLAPGFTGVGKTLMELQLRETIGVNIAMIRRGSFTIHVPDRFEKIYPGDILYVIGTDEQLEAFKDHMENSSKVVVNPNAPEREVSLQQVEVTEGSELDGVTIKASAIRERTKGLIVGIERNGERILNPDSSVTLRAHDLLWIVGNQKRIKLLLKKGQLS
jgi:CPA2 family monovalent cation:H+ antiporter-2